jgi:hypothetical protein
VAELSVSEWAEREKISRQAAWKRIKSGKVKLNANGKVDVEEAQRQWDSNRNAVQQRAKPDPKPSPKAKAEEDPRSLASAQKAREWLRVAKEKLLLEKMQGDLLEKEEVERAWAQMISSARSRLLLLPNKIAQRVAVMTDVHQVRAAIDEEIRDALSELSESTE